MAHHPRSRIRRGDILQEDATGARYVVVYGNTKLAHLILRPEDAPLDQSLQRSLTIAELNSQHWIHRPKQRKEVKRMARTDTNGGPARRGVPTPPKMTRQEWLKRDKTTVSLTRGELEQLGKLVSAGHVLLRNEPSISPKLKAAMTRLGINTRGL